MAAIRLTQQHIQYAADASTNSVVRVTRLFAQVARSSAGAVVKVVNQTIFATTPQTLVFEDHFFVNANLTIFGDVADNEWTYDPVYNVFISQALFGAAGDNTAEALYFPVAHTMLSGVASPDAYREITQYLGFTERFFEDVTQLLFTELEPGVATIAESVSVLHVMFSVGPQVAQAHNASDSLGWSTAVAQVFDNSILERMGLSETLDSSATGYGRSETHGGFMKQSIAISVTGNACREEEYSPLIGESGDETFESMAVAGPVLSDGNTLTLTYPFVSPTLTLILENPDFGNTDTFNFTRLDRKTRGGDRKLLTDAKWAKWERLELSMTGIDCNATVDEIITFLNASLGKEIGFADWEGRTWKGIIVAPDTDIIEQQTGRALKLVFEGEVTTLDVQYNDFDVIHGQDTDGTNIQVTYEESE